MSTIAAIATPQAAGGIAVIRISGPDAFCIADRVFQGAGGKQEACGEQKGFVFYIHCIFFMSQ